MRKSLQIAGTMGLLSPLALLLGTSLAQAQTALTFCNATPSKIFVNLVYLETKTNKWTMKSWWSVDAKGCTLVGNYQKGKVFYYAEHGPGKTHWPTKANIKKTYCISNSQVERVMLNGPCATGERTVGFNEIALSGTGTFKYTLNP